MFQASNSSVLRERMFGVDVAAAHEARDIVGIAGGLAAQEAAVAFAGDAGADLDRHAGPGQPGEPAQPRGALALHDRVQVAREADVEVLRQLIERAVQPRE